MDGVDDLGAVDALEVDRGDAEVGSCSPGPGSHVPVGDVFQLGYTPGPSREGGWRRCRRCKAVFYDGWETKGACPNWEGGLGHVAEGYDYQMQFDVQPDPHQQPDWRFCTKCYGLFCFPEIADSDCAAGGQHHATETVYVLTRVH